MELASSLLGPGGTVLVLPGVGRTPSKPSRLFFLSWAWWYITLISVLKRQKQVGVYACKASLVNIASSTTAQATY